MISNKKLKSKKVLVSSLFVTSFSIATVVYAQSAKVGSLEIEDAYTRATVPGQQVAGGFLKIENKGTVDQLVSASSLVAGQVQIHEMAMEGNVMKMRQIKDLNVPAGGSVELKPGSYHLMFINLKSPLVAGETVPVKLNFAKAGEVEVKLPVKVMGTGAMKH